jgi:hypothetical protein
MPHRINAAMDQVEGPTAQSNFDRPAADPKLGKLATRYHPMLLLSKRCDGSIHRHIEVTPAFAVYATVNAGVSAGG